MIAGGMVRDAYGLEATAASAEAVQAFLASAMQAGLHDDARRLLERIAGRYPLPQRRPIGYAAATHAVGL